MVDSNNRKLTFINLNFSGLIFNKSFTDHGWMSEIIQERFQRWISGKNDLLELFS